MQRQREVVPAQLPRDPGDFVGRSAEADLVRKIGTIRTNTQSPVVLVSGPPGVGKSAFAVHIAHELATRFYGGQVYLDLRAGHPDSLSPRDALISLLLGLNVSPPAQPMPTTALASIWRSQVST